MVARSQQTSVDDLHSAVSTIKAAKGNILGVVVTDVDRRLKSSYYGKGKRGKYYYYESEYGYGYGSQPPRERKRKAGMTESQAETSETK